MAASFLISPSYIYVLVLTVLHVHSTEEHLRSCELQGKYAEAEVAKNRLDELRKHEENRLKEEVRSKQIAERLGVEEAHMIEFQNFNKVGVVNIS